ncbi:MAG: GDSL-type esterase/lipase family protein [Spirochaetales bacterium]|uniref:GDSL-type esterase/lipase family protein n=1 Tax=Candidatus Thalassospirochaeta sargassi TaxID=3119039 RepID=A0AAJ1IGE1_9SPIO|nr:GDSL-type esterase/lipase family protein [Spirochaetales bacterium]
MYRILCFGDSNTWGYNPANGLRFSVNERWPGVLRDNLGAGFEIIEDGMNGRRILEDIEVFESSLNSNSPLDVIIIYLGVNDICFEKDIKLSEILDGARAYVEKVKDQYRDLGDAAPELVFIGAVPVNEEQINDGLYDIEAGKVLRFSEELRALSEKLGCGFIESGRIIESSSLDGIHLEAGEHQKLGAFVADYVRSFLKNSSLNNMKNY